MKISILIPCHNEEKSIRKCVESCLKQTRLADQILVVNDGSTDDSGKILASFGDKIEVLTVPVATGNKSYAQQLGLEKITGDVFIATDGDTMLDSKLVERVYINFQDKNLSALGGYVKSLKYNWLTGCRELEYFIGQNVHKLAQSYMNFVFIISGCAGAFRTDTFKNFITFDHDTITEDLDFTYKFHRHSLKVGYDRQMIVFTQDPPTMHSYINQIRRWYAGGWQNLIKHHKVMNSPVRVLELTLLYVEGLIFSLLLYILPLINLQLALYFLFLNSLVYFIFAIFIAIRKERRDLILYVPFYLLLSFVNAWVFIEQFFKIMILKQKSLIWFQPKRIKL